MYGSSKYNNLQYGCLLVKLDVKNYIWTYLFIIGNICETQFPLNDWVTFTVQFIFFYNLLKTVHISPS
uniref:Uncharacterized protein n=1 Tax=Octopus bimaculoides TaxID=37653 RepID=A0A0L8FIM7_OCTBM